MTPRRKNSEAALRTPTVLVMGRIRARVPIIRKALERYGLTTATLAWKSSASGLWRLGAKTPQVIVVDIPPPVTADHVEMLQRLRDRWEHAPQLVVTAGASPSVLTSLLAVGVDDFVADEDAWGELIVRLRRQLRRVSPQTMPGTMGPDGMQMDAARRTVSAHGRTVSLTTREFDVFACLAESGGKILSREDILRQVWGNADDRPSTAGIVGVYILYLRRKLTKLGLAHALRTIKGEGYSFQAPGDYWAPTQGSAASAAGSRASARDLHPSTAARNAGATNDDLDVAAKSEQNPNQPVRRKAL
jgi:DNA-binding response OmpR family regulator